MSPAVQFGEPSRYQVLTAYESRVDGNCSPEFAKCDTNSREQFDAFIIG